MKFPPLGKGIQPALKLCLLFLSTGFISEARPDSIDDFVKSEMQRLHIPGLVYGIVKNGQLVRSQALGFADVEAKREAKQEDLFEMGSLTKQFTSMGLMILVEVGKVDLEDPITKYLSDAPPAWSSVKIRNLLYQNSGLPDYDFVPKLGVLSKYSRAEFMTAMAKVAVDFPSGEAWAYSNTNYALLGWVIEEVTKEPYSKFIEENILHPVGMTHTTFVEPGVSITGLAKGYVMKNGLATTAPQSVASTKADGALISNLADMLKWDEALSDFRLVSRKSYTALWTRGKLNSGRVRPYGMGWYLSMPYATPYMGHGGNSSGYSAGISRFPKTRLSAIVLTNISPINGEAISKKIAELYEPGVKPAPFIPINDPDPARTELVKKAIECLTINWPDDKLLEPELSAPMKTNRAKQGGAGPWRQLLFIDDVALGDVRQQGPDTALTYRMISMGKAFLVVVLWSPNNKLAQANLYATDMPDPAPKIGN